MTLILLGSSMILSACTNQSEPSSKSGPKPEPINQEQVTLANGVVEANNLLSIDFYDKYKLKDGNLFFSPYSILSALAMTYEGAKGQTAEEMQSVLHLPSDKETVRTDFMEIFSEINKEDKSYQLTTANSLWAQENYPFKENYFEVVDEYYSGNVTNLDFKTETEKSRVTINNWVEEKTNDKIKELLPKTPQVITPNTKLVLTNTIYFKADWQNKFNIRNTKDKEFKLSDGTSKDVETMHQMDDFNYGENKDLQILEMDYQGDDLSMLVILPKENNLSSIEELINTENLNNWKKEMSSEKVRLSIPKFKFEKKYFMSKDLKEMGMISAFNSSWADFTGMWNKQNDENLYISEVIHQTFIDVAEEGTEAAAATAVVMNESTSIGGTTTEPKIFTADHPFIFLIQQKDTGNILFMGRVSDPSN